ncbi:MAG TPA: cell wall hydrolase, partial [Sphingomonas sp.]|nr:cell wall hydrolase [Sphingomonas sp.]
VYFEAKSEPLEGQLAVAEVVMHRAVAGGRFPPSICSVVFQKGQFSFVRGNGFPPIGRSSASWKTAVAIAQIALNNGWDSRASGALYFHAAGVRPGWNKVRVAQLGNHIFYR